MLRNSLNDAERHIRPQIQDLAIDNIAELARLASRLEGVIPLWYGEGDVATPGFIKDAAKKALDAGLTFYIPDMRGYGPLTQALSDYQTRLHGTEISRERSTVTPGGMQALHLALTLVAEMGTNAVYVEPQWPNIRRIIHIAGAEPRAVSLDFADNDWRLDLDKLFAACDARTRAIVLSTPSNPLGWVASPAELKALLDFSRERGIWVVSDEVYNRLYFAESGVAPSILTIAEPEDLVMTVNSFSKSWAMTGWRVGWLTHPLSVAGKLAGMTQFINSGTAGFVQAGAHAAMTSGEGLVTEMRERCRRGLDLAYERLRDPFRLTARPRGGMYAVFSVDGEDDATEACKLILERARVGLAPGHLFGPAARPFLRMCVCRDAVELERAFERMSSVF